jgi:hypothetical protein
MIFVLINILVARVAATTSTTCAIRRLLLYHAAMTRFPFFHPREWENYFNYKKKKKTTQSKKKRRKKKGSA